MTSTFSGAGGRELTLWSRRAISCKSDMVSGSHRKGGADFKGVTRLNLKKEGDYKDV
jgi:hypothetical protein